MVLLKRVKSLISDQSVFAKRFLEADVNKSSPFLSTYRKN